jgi:hypothetical protein
MKKTTFIIAALGLVTAATIANADSYDIPGYHIQLLPPPPGAIEYTQAWGLNNKGIVVGDSDGGSWLYDTKTGAYSPVDDFYPITINNNGVMGGQSLDGNCAIRDKKGNITEFSTPTLEALGEPCGRSVRAVSENGKATGFEIASDGTWFGFVYDSKSGITEEFLANTFPERTIAHGITNSGTIVGTTLANDGDRAAFVRSKDGSVKTFRAANPDAIPRFTNARGISDNGKLISGFYANLDFDQVAFVVESSALSSGVGNSDVEVTVLEIERCNPDSFSPPAGYLGFTDVLAYEVRNDGVILGGCVDYYWDPVNDPNFEDLIIEFEYTFIATPQ